VPRSYEQRTPKKMKAAALRGALSDRVSHGRLAVVSAFVENGEPSTADALAVLRTAVGEAEARLQRPVLVVLTSDDKLARKSLRNVPRVRVLESGQLNTYDVLAADHVVFTQAALAEFVARTGGGELVTVAKPAAKPARAARPKAAAADGEDSGEPAAKPARSARPKAAAADGEDSGEPAAKPAKAPASRARKAAPASATESADDVGDDAAPPVVKQRSSGTSRKPASSGSGAAQEEEE
jgi:large subunit ribosomal protein L4